MCVVRLHRTHLSECHRVCLRLGGPVICCQCVALTCVHSGIDFLTNCMRCSAHSNHPVLWSTSPPSIELSPLFCLSQWGQLLSTIAQTTAEFDRCEWNSPPHYCTLKNCRPEQSSVHCCKMLPWNNAYSSSLFILSMTGYNGMSESVGGGSFLMQA